MIGGIGLHKINHFDNRTGIGYWLGEEFWRKGYMSEAASALIQYAFNVMGFNRIDVSAAVENAASNATIRKLGFVFEGIARQQYRSKATNALHDANTYGLLREDWLRQNQQKDTEK